MKKIICILMAICVIASGFAACDNSPEIVAGEKYVRGTVAGDTWTSDWLGLTYTLTDGFQFTPEEELESLMEITADTIFEDENGEAYVDYSKVDVVYEMMAYHDDGSNVVVSSEMNMTGLREKEYMEYIRLQIVQAAIEYDFTELYDFQVGNVVMKRSDGFTYAYGDLLYQTYLLLTRGDRIISIVVSAPQKDAVEKIIACFG